MNKTYNTAKLKVKSVEIGRTRKQVIRVKQVIQVKKVVGLPPPHSNYSGVFF